MEREGDPAAEDLREMIRELSLRGTDGPAQVYFDMPDENPAGQSVPAQGVVD